MQSAKPLIAVVDDEETIRSALRRLLLSGGFEVEVFADGSAFVSSLRARQPRCVILDLHMPVMCGFEVQEHLAAAGLSLPVLIITGHDSDATRDRALAAGAVAYLRKPVDSQVLFDAIAVAMSRGAH